MYACIYKLNIIQDVPNLNVKTLEAGIDEQRKKVLQKFARFCFNFKKIAKNKQKCLLHFGENLQRFVFLVY